MTTVLDYGRRSFRFRRAILCLTAIIFIIIPVVIISYVFDLHTTYERWAAERRCVTYDKSPAIAIWVPCGTLEKSLSDEAALTTDTSAKNVLTPLLRAAAIAELDVARMGCVVFMHGRQCGDENMIIVVTAQYNGDEMRLTPIAIKEGGVFGVAKFVKNQVADSNGFIKNRDAIDIAFPIKGGMTESDFAIYWGVPDPALRSTFSIQVRSGRSFWFIRGELKPGGRVSLAYEKSE